MCDLEGVPAAEFRSHSFSEYAVYEVYKVLTAAGFVFSVGTVLGKVAHFALFDTLSITTSKPQGRAGRRRGSAALCNRNQKQDVTNI